MLGSGTEGTLIPNYNQMSVHLGGLTNPEGCVWVQETNGYRCGNDKVFYVLQYQSIDRDSDSRVIWPVYASPVNLTYYATTYYNYNGMYTNTTNNTNTTNTTNNNTDNSTTNSSTDPYSLNPPP